MQHIVFPFDSQLTVSNNSATFLLLTVYAYSSANFRTVLSESQNTPTQHQIVRIHPSLIIVQFVLARDPFPFPGEPDIRKNSSLRALRE